MTHFVVFAKLLAVDNLLATFLSKIVYKRYNVDVYILIMYNLVNNLLVT
jgi:hypothetical protein